MNNIFSSLSKIIERIFDKNEKMTSRIGISIFLVLIIITIDSLLGFSFHYDNFKKIENINKIEDIKNNYNLDYIVLEKLNNIETEVIDRKNIFKIGFGYLKGFDIPIINFPKLPLLPTPIYYILYFLSINWIWIIVFFMVLKQSPKNFPLAVAAFILILIFMLIFLFFFNWLYSILGVNAWGWRLLLNIIIIFGLLIILALIGNKKTTL